ncbi:MAG: putative hydroxymethylpyrimidine transporter CytX [Eubacterium sp.]|nr:putative hydroxymethylpyrimidine transporter CytX [Eubacterium sp.]
MSRKTSVLENGLIWFGAAVGLAEILSGTYLAPLGFSKGLLSVLIGHAIGCVLLFLAGYIGGKTCSSAMETVTFSFGSKGGYFFALLNVLQLVGWTAIMIYDGSLAANGVFHIGSGIWAVVIGGLILIWILIGIQSLGKLNIVAMSALFILTIILSVQVFGGGAAPAVSQETLTFGAAIELNVAMPLSWVPLISDYTREAEKPVAATLCSTVVYGLVSCWMYVIGMCAAIFAGTSDIAEIMLKAGLGILGLLIVVFATVTTTFLDAYSAGVSSELFSEKLNGKWIAVAATVIGTLAAVLYPMDNITGFLYLIGSVFAPMIAVQIVDFFILKVRHDERKFCVENLIIWLIGFLLYRYLMGFDFVIGSTLLDIAITMALCIAAGLIRKAIAGSKQQNGRPA